MSSLLAIDLAIYERLVGAPLDSKGRPKADVNGIPVNRSIIASASNVTRRLPSYGIRLPSVRQGVDGSRGSTGHAVAPLHPSKDFRYVAPRQVPVFPINIEGREWKVVYPCITFYWYETAFDPTTFIYDDPFCAPDSSASTVTSDEGDEGAKRNAFRAHPDSYLETYVIRAWSKSLAEMKILTSEIRRLFPARGVLEIVRSDGTKLPLDMILDRIDNFDIGDLDVPMSQNSDEDRAFSRAFIFNIESYEDNAGGFDAVDVGCTGQVSQAQWYDETIRTRVLEMVNLREGDLTTTTIFPYLVSLISTPVDLAPVYEVGVSAYTITLINNQAHYTLTPTSSDPSAQVVHIDSNLVASGDTIELIPTVFEAYSVINVDVTEDSTTETYEVTITRSTTPQILLASIQGQSANLGYGTSLDYRGDVMIAGAPGEHLNDPLVGTGIGRQAGALYVYNRDASGVWSETARLRPPSVDGDPTGSSSGDRFGQYSVISSDGLTIAALASRSRSGVQGDPFDNSVTNAGSVYIYELIAGVWTEVAYIQPSTIIASALFGSIATLSSDGSVLAVSASNETSNTGAVYVFRRVGASWSSWVQEQKITAPNAELQDFFGGRVALSYDGSTLAISATSEDSSSTGVYFNPGDPALLDNSLSNSGAVYVYRYVSGSWVFDAYIKSTVSVAGGLYGLWLGFAQNGYTLAIGHPFGDSQTGIVEIFEGGPGAWVLTAQIQAPNGEGTSEGINPATNGDRFGYSFGIDEAGELLVVGSPYEDGSGVGIDPADNNGASNSGAVYVFRKISGVWTFQHYVKAQPLPTGDSRNDDVWGWAVSLSGDGSTSAIPGPEAGDPVSVNRSGAVWVY